MAAKKRQLWYVGHADGLHAKVWVAADSWEQATVEAAKLWDVPWGTVAAYCVEFNRKPEMKNVCARCGRFFSGKETLCDACRKVQETEELRTRQCAVKDIRRLWAAGR